MRKPFSSESLRRDARGGCPQALRLRDIVRNASPGGQVPEILSLNGQETEDFLARHGCVRHYTTHDLNPETFAKLLAR